MEVELMVTTTDQPTNQQGEYRAICLWKVGRQSFAINLQSLEYEYYLKQGKGKKITGLFGNFYQHGTGRVSFQFPKP